MIDPTSAVAAFWRSHLSAVSRVAPVGARSAGASQASAKRQQAPSERSDGAKHQRADVQAMALSDVLITRVRAIAPDDDQRRRKAFRIFLETLLSQEWGEAATADPAFYALIEQVQSQVMADAKLSVLADRAADELLVMAGSAVFKEV